MSQVCSFGDVLTLALCKTDRIRILGAPRCAAAVEPLQLDGTK